MTRWKVGLSNGENFIEGSRIFSVVPGELSPWLKLREYLKEKNLSITSLSLWYLDRTFNLPSAGNHPKFLAFADAPKPIGFDFSRRISGPLYGKSVTIDQTFAVIEAIYSDYRLQVWVDEKNPSNSWVLLV